MNTHETYIHSIADIVLARLTPSERNAFAGFKLAYGSGPAGTRGVTFFRRWKSNGHAPQRWFYVSSYRSNRFHKPVRVGGCCQAHDPVPFVEIAAFGQESLVQLAGTTVHELGHVLAGMGAGHSKAWKEACERLGLSGIKAAGTEYTWDMFDPEIRDPILALPKPNDGEPVTSLSGLGPLRLKPCGAGIGTRGGSSRGTGSGSRLKKAWCTECGYTVRLTAKWLAVAVPTCPDPDCFAHGKAMANEAGFTAFNS